MDIETILGRQINSVKELKSAISDLQNSLIGVDTASEEFKTTSEKLSAAQAELNKVTTAGKQDMDAASDSIRGMEKEYKTLYDTYKKLSEEQRNSDFGKNMAKSLEELSAKINETKKEVGNFKDNIGHYSEGVTEAFSNMGLSIGGLQGPLNLAKNGSTGLKGAFDLLSKHPIMMVITALVAIFMKAADAIKNNEQLTQRLHQAFAAFQPIVNAISNAFDFLAGVIVKVVEGAAKLFEKIASLSPKMREQIQLTKELAAANDELANSQRAVNEENAGLAAEVEELRELASEETNATKKRELLIQAKEKQAQIDQNNIRIAQEELRVLEEQSKLTANSKEDNDELSAARIKVANATAQASRNERRFNREINATKTAAKSATPAVKEYAETVDSAKTAAEEIYNRTVEDSKDEVTKLTEKYNAEKAQLEAYNLDTALLTEQYNAKIDAINQKQLDKERQIAEEKRKLHEEELAKEQELIDNLKEYEENALEERRNAILDTFLSITDALGTMFSAIENVIEAELKSGDITEEEAKRKEKAIKNLRKVELAVSIAGIAAQTAAGIMAIQRGLAEEYAGNAIAAAGSAFLGPVAYADTILALNAASRVRAALNTAAIAAAGASQVAAAVGGYIAKNKSAAGSSSAAGGATTVPEVVEPEPYGYTRNVQTVEDIDYLNQQPIFVSVTDIDSALGKKATLVQETSF